MRHAVIDIGTNTLLLLIAERRGDAVAAVEEACEFGRLGKGLDKTGRLDPDAVATSLAICQRYRARMDAHGLGATQVSIIGTAALRDAANAHEFVGPAQAIFGVPIEIIAGQREAELAAASVRSALPALTQGAYVVVDVGGGSTELIVCDGAQLRYATSVRLGAVRLTERCVTAHPVTALEQGAVLAACADLLAPLPLPMGLPIIATAGTATTLAAVALGLTNYDATKVTGVRFAPSELQALVARLAGASVERRTAMPGMEAKRADVIVAGALILQAVVAQTNAPALVVCDRGIRWGLAEEVLRPAIAR